MKTSRKEIFKWAGYLGLALLVIGYLRYSVQELLDTINKVLLIAGGVLAAAGLMYHLRGIRTYFQRRSARLGANTAVMTVAVVAIIGLLNFLGYRHHKRIDVTSEQLYSLSDQTRKIVSGLKQDVRVIKFDNKDDQVLTDRMAEYRDLSGRITYERIDPQVRPELAKQYEITRMGEVIVASGSRIERPQDTNEQTLTNAILKVTRDTLKKIYFVEGHGEKKLGEMNQGEGYGLVEKWLKDENYEVKTVNLVSSNQVPNDCDVLVLAGPKQPLFPQEATMIGKYLEAGGKAMLLLDPDIESQMDDVLKTWNIELGKDTVIDFSGVGRLFGTGPAVPLARPDASHAITKDMENTMTFFPLARSVSVTTGSGAPVTTTELLKTSEQSFAETELIGNEAKLDPGKDKEGPITVGVAASRTAGEKEARLVVIGDSDFAANQSAQFPPNANLFMNSINWLAQDEDLISIRPKNPEDRRVTMTASQQNLLFWLSIVLMPGAVIASGIYIWWKRR